MNSTDIDTGYRVHIGNEVATFLLLDVWGVTSAEQAVEKAKGLRYARTYDGYLSMTHYGKIGMGMGFITVRRMGDFDQFDAPEPVWDEQDLSSLEFWSDEEMDAL